MTVSEIVKGVTATIIILQLLIIQPLLNYRKPYSTIVNTVACKLVKVN